MAYLRGAAFFRSKEVADVVSQFVVVTANSSLTANFVPIHDLIMYSVTLNEPNSVHYLSECRKQNAAASIVTTTRQHFVATL